MKRGERGGGAEGKSYIRKGRIRIKERRRKLEQTEDRRTKEGREEERKGERWKGEGRDMWGKKRE